MAVTTSYRLSFLISLIGIIGISCLGDKAPQDQRPNILFIMADDHTSQAWGIYGGVLDSFITNPNIRRLAAEGATLRRVYCTNSICVPSRASILTGQYSHQNGVFTLSDSLHGAKPNIAKSLQESGYRTAVIGKWHLKNRPSGFDDFLVLPGQGRYNDPILRSAENWDDGGKVYNGFSADVIGNESVKWLEERPKDQPFFLMTHFKATHEPFDYPDRHAQYLVEEELPEPPTLMEFDASMNGRSFSGQVLEILGNRWEEDSKDMSSNRYPGLPFSTRGLDLYAARKKIYQKLVRDFLRSGLAIDDNIGKILDFLDRENIADNTVVIYTSDQGYFLGEHGFFDKRMIYEEAIRMPFVIRYPQEITAGIKNDDLIVNIDFPALLSDYAGIEKPQFIMGKSFRKNLLGETPDDWRESVYYRYWLHREERPAHFGIRTARHKLAFFYGLPLGMTGAMNKSTPPAWEFYDLENDPYESQNAVSDPAYSAIIRQMKDQLRQLRYELGDEDLDSEIMQAVIKQHW